MNLRDPALDAGAVIKALDLQPHPEGGHYRETFRDAPEDGSRGAVTSILFLLRAEESSHWHRVDAVEIWHWHAGGPLVLSVSPDGHDASAYRLGPDLAQHETLQGIVPAGYWQAAAALGRWALVGCTVAPSFQFSGFELAPPDWRPTPRPLRR
jgi:predicted cupin superfamily sugar epimerase